MKSGRFFKRTTFVLALLLSLVLAGQAAFAAVLSDIQGHWAAEEIEQAVEQGYVKGYPDGCFRPDRAVSRAEFVSLVGGAFQLEGSDYQVNFKDVSDSDWFYGRLASVVEAAYVAGYPDGTFRPQQSITRQEAACILSKLLQVPDASVELSFQDAAQIGVWARPGVARMVEHGIIKGRPDNTFAPLLPITRAESVVMINQVVAFLKGELPEKQPVEEGKPALKLEPLEQKKSVGTMVKVTATYLDSEGKNVKGEKVQFTVSRDDKIELEKELATDQSGQAVLEYKGPNKPATDKVKAAAGELEAVATVKWVTAGGGGGGGGGGGSSTTSEYKIELTVKDAGGNTVDGAVVELYSGDALTPSKTLKTGSDGKVSFAGLSKGSYKISVQKVAGDEYLAGYKDIDSLSSNQEIDIEVRSALVLKGTLTDAEGNPLANTPVVAKVNPIFRTTTDGAGRYTLPVASGEGLPDAAYSVMVLVGDKNYEVAKVPARVAPQELTLPEFQTPVDEGALPAVDAAVARLQEIYGFLDAGDKKALDAARDKAKQLADFDLNEIVQPVVSQLNKEARDALSSYSGGAEAFFMDAVKEAALITYSSDKSQLKKQLEDYRAQFGPGVSALFELTAAEGTAVDDLFGLFLDVEAEVPEVLAGEVENLVAGDYQYFAENVDKWAEKALLNAVEKKHSQFKGSLAVIGLTTGDLFAARNRLSDKVDSDQSAEIALAKAVVRSGAVGEGPSFVAKDQTARYGLSVLNVPVEKIVNWKSSDKTVATMGSGEGDKNYLTAKEAGTTTITAYKNNPDTEWIWKIEVKVL